MNGLRNRKFALGAAVIGLASMVGLFWRVGPAASTPHIASPPALTVEMVKPELLNWPDVVYANGNLAAWQEAVISAETGSLRITALLVDVGSVVRRGQLLAQLADSNAENEVRKQKAMVAQARGNLDKAQSDVRRSKLVSESGSLSMQKIDEYRNTEAIDLALLDSAEADLQSKLTVLAQTRVLAVDDGIISSRSALLGNVVNTGAELFRLLRHGRIEWQAELDAQQLSHVQAGQLAHVTLPGGRVVNGTVRLAAPTLSVSTGRAIVYISLPKDCGAQSGMFASGSIEQGHRAALTLPESSIMQRDGRSDIYVLNADGVSVARRTVVTGRREAGRVEVISDLDRDANVVARGGSFLSDGVLVKVVEANAASPRAVE